MCTDGRRRKSVFGKPFPSRQRAFVRGWISPQLYTRWRPGALFALPISAPSVFIVRTTAKSARDSVGPGIYDFGSPRPLSPLLPLPRPGRKTRPKEARAVGRYNYYCYIPECIYTTAIIPRVPRVPRVFIEGGGKSAVL